MGHDTNSGRARLNGRWVFRTCTQHQLLVRELILQLKTGRIARDYFEAKFGADILTEFGGGYSKLESEGLLKVSSDGVAVTPSGLMQIDRHLPTFFDPQYIGTRYT